MTRPRNVRNFISFGKKDTWRTKRAQDDGKGGHGLLTVVADGSPETDVKLRTVAATTSRATDPQPHVINYRKKIQIMTY